MSTYQKTLDNSIIDIFEAEDLFDEIYGIFKTKMDKEHLLDAAGQELPQIVNSIIHGKLVQIDLNIAISSGDLGLNMYVPKKRVVKTVIKGKLIDVNLDSIEAREDFAREEQQKLLLGQD